MKNCHYHNLLRPSKQVVGSIYPGSYTDPRGLYTNSLLLISTEHNQMKSVNGSAGSVHLTAEIHRVGELNFINSWLKERETVPIQIYFAFSCLPYNPKWFLCGAANLVCEIALQMTWEVIFKLRSTHVYLMWMHIIIFCCK
jgi:hypothetical protein